MCTRASGEGSSGWEETQVAKINQGDFTFYPQRKWFKDPRKYGEVYKGQVYFPNNTTYIHVVYLRHKLSTFPSKLFPVWNNGCWVGSPVVKVLKVQEDEPLQEHLT